MLSLSNRPESSRPSAGSSRAWLLVVFALATVATALAVDMPVERFFANHRPGGTTSDLMNALEVFGNGFGVLLVLVAIAVLDRQNRMVSVRVGAAAFGAGLLANVAKLMVARTRPQATDLADASVLDTFVGLAPLGEGGYAAQSFPSAHTATATGLAIGLAFAYPHGRAFFLMLAAGVAAQRMWVGHHYPSDVLLGAALATGWARLCLPGRTVGVWIDRATRRFSATDEPEAGSRESSEESRPRRAA